MQQPHFDPYAQGGGMQQQQGMQAPVPQAQPPHYPSAQLSGRFSLTVPFQALPNQMQTPNMPQAQMMNNGDGNGNGGGFGGAGAMPGQQDPWGGQGGDFAPLGCAGDMAQVPGQQHGGFGGGIPGGGGFLQAGASQAMVPQGFPGQQGAGYSQGGGGGGGGGGGFPLMAPQQGLMPPQQYGGHQGGIKIGSASEIRGLAGHSSAGRQMADSFVRQYPQFQRLQKNRQKIKHTTRWSTRDEATFQTMRGQLQAIQREAERMIPGYKLDIAAYRYMLGQQIRI